MPLYVTLAVASLSIGFWAGSQDKKSRPTKDSSSLAPQQKSGPNNASNGPHEELADGSGDSDDDSEEENDISSLHADPGEECKLVRLALLLSLFGLTIHVLYLGSRRSY